MIQFHDVSRRFGKKLAVDRLSLEVPAGEVFAFLGPNGAGKTTSIKMLVGLLRPTSGTVRVCGHDTVAQTRQAVRHLGYVPDEPYLYDKLSGREFLDFVAQMRGLEPREASLRIARETERFELGEFLDELIETYSHGMRQRLVFASALLHDPPVLVIYEPMVGLDPRSVRLAKDLLRGRAAAGAAVFVSTHTLALAEEIAHRIGIIDRGRLCFLGTVDRLQQELAAPERSLEQLFLTLTSDGDGRAPAQVPMDSREAGCR